MLPHTQSGEATLAYDNAAGDLVVEYRLARHVHAPEKPPDVFVFGPNDFRQALPMHKIGDGAWRGTVPIGNRQGLFRVRPVQESRLFPETGLYREEEEMNQFGSNEPLLRRISEYTGGRFSPNPADVFDARGRSIPSTMALWPGLLLAALALNLAELVIRKWRGIIDSFQRRRATA
jgi:hypothetical protein